MFSRRLSPFSAWRLLGDVAVNGSSFARLFVLAWLAVVFTVMALLPLSVHAQEFGPPQTEGTTLFIADSFPCGSNWCTDAPSGEFAQPWFQHACFEGGCFIPTQSQSSAFPEALQFDSPFSVWMAVPFAEPVEEPPAFDAQNPSHWLQVIFWMCALGFGLHGYSVGGRDV